MRAVRVCTGFVLVASGALMYAASWQRWSGACGWGQEEGATCGPLQDHRYDFVVPRAPWEPVGDAATLAGLSLLALALAVVVLPAALAGRRPHLVVSVAAVALGLAVADAGLATVRSGIAGQVMSTWGGGLSGALGFLVLPAMLAGLAVVTRGWPLAAAVLLTLASPLVAAFTYAVGPYDAQPWWEAVSGTFTAAAGLCLVMAARGVRRPSASGLSPTPVRT
ncbi:hypothetical protein GCM10009623_30870 [Nocardioides aestuarii]|uniref:DUF998 domain-containing protein n=1 Tax=Nocardioides aestuarii TaxID=252231 RepID=A0ABW4TRQ4_9ACTN